MSQAVRHIGYGNAVAGVGQRGYEPPFCPVSRTPILYMHGATLDATALYATGTWYEQATLATGSAHYSIDTGDSYANSTGRGRPAQLKTWVQTAANGRPAKSGKAIYSGASMGAQNVFAAILDAPANCAGAIVQIALPNVDRVVQDTVNFPAIQGSVFTAHGGNPASGTGWAADKATSDINLYAEALGATGVPILWIYSTNDPFYTEAEVLACAARIGSTCTAVSQGAQAHTVTSTPAAVVDQAISFIVAHQQ